MRAYRLPRPFLVAVVAVVAAVALRCPSAEAKDQAPPAGAEQAAPSEEALKKLAKDLDNVSLLKSASGSRAVDQFERWGTAARAATPYVLPLLQHKKAEVRVNAAVVLGSIDPEGALTPLKTLAFKDPDAGVRRAAAAAIRDERALAELVRAAPRDAREEAASRLSKSPILREIALGDANPEVRGDAIFALADKDVVEGIVKADALPAVRRWAEIAAAADPVREIKLLKIGCDPMDTSLVGGFKKQQSLVCTLEVTNSGPAAFESTTWDFVDAGTGDGTSPDRIEPGEKKKLYFFVTAANVARPKVGAVLRSAVVRRPAGGAK